MTIYSRTVMYLLEMGDYDIPDFVVICSPWFSGRKDALIDIGLLHKQINIVNLPIGAFKEPKNHNAI